MNSLIVIDDLIINANSIKHITPTHIYYEVFNETDLSNTTIQKHIMYYKKTKIQIYDSADQIEVKSGNTTNHKWSWVKHEINSRQFKQICEYIKNHKGEKGWLN